MDIVAHALWAGAAASWLRRKKPEITRKGVAATVGFAVLPDLAAIVPALLWSFTEAAPLQFLYAHITAVPGTQPGMPSVADNLANHLHCTFHSVIVAGAVTAAVWWKRPRLLFPLLGWWMHILLDVPTHSEDYYPVPVFYPLTYWGFDGVAWTEPWMLALNYLALVATYAALLLSRRRVRSSGHGSE